jgi:hypothetical protein
MAKGLGGARLLLLGLSACGGLVRGKSDEELPAPSSQTPTPKQNEGGASGDGDSADPPAATGNGDVADPQGATGTGDISEPRAAPGDSPDERDRQTRCALPFDSGACNVMRRVYTVIDGVCVPAAYGGCGGNENRFTTLEECVATCEGPPREPCSVGDDARKICVECAATGGSARFETICTRRCSRRSPCRAGFTCVDNLCEPPACL